MLVEFGKIVDGVGKRQVIVASIALLFAIAIADYLNGRELSLSSLYLIPVMVITWKCSSGAGIAMALAAYALLLGVNLQLEQASASLGYVVWEGAIRFSTAALFVFVLSGLRDSLAREQLLARTDALTGLMNRSAFYDLVSREMSRCKRYGGMLSVVFIDLDNFKELNDSLGHQVGDMALQVVAKTLRDQLRSADVAARFGGDEFAVMLTQTNVGAASKATHALQSRLLQSMKNRHWNVTFSAGLATFETIPESVDEMVKCADALMYEAKHGTKGHIREKVFK